MAKCTKCDYPYATNLKCPNCGTTNPRSKGIGFFGIIIIIVILYYISKS